MKQQNKDREKANPAELAKLEEDVKREVNRVPIEKLGLDTEDGNFEFFNRGNGKGHHVSREIVGRIEKGDTITSALLWNTVNMALGKRRDEVKSICEELRRKPQLLFMGHRNKDRRFERAPDLHSSLSEVLLWFIDRLATP